MGFCATFDGVLATFMPLSAKLGQENILRMVRWMRWHCLPDTDLEIRSLAICVILRTSTLPTILVLNFTSERGRNFCFSETCMPERGTNPLSPLSAHKLGINPMLFKCWSTVFDAGQTLKQHWAKATQSGQNRQKISIFNFGLLLYMTMWCKHVHRLQIAD